MPIAKKPLPQVPTPTATATAIATAPVLKPALPQIQTQLQQQLEGHKSISIEHATTGTAAAASTTTTTTATVTSIVTSGNSAVATVPPAAAATSSVPVDVNWLFICDWRNCPRRKFRSLNELQHHVCNVHCPDHLDAGAEIYCQWGSGPSLCDNIARKRYSLMTHLVDRHLALDDLRASVQRRLATGIHNVAPTQPTVTIVRNVANAAAAAAAAAGTSATPGAAAAAAATSATAVGTSALQAIKRHSADFLNSKELMDENEGPVTKSIRLTAALILRNLVNYTSTAKRGLKRYEPHLANVAFSNVEASGVLSHILHELSQ